MRRNKKSVAKKPTRKSSTNNNEESFQSASTDPNVTNYNLEYTNGRANVQHRMTRSASKTPIASIRQQQSTESSGEFSEPVSGNERALPSTSENRGLEGSARRKQANPRKSNKFYIIREANKRSESERLIPKYAFAKVVQEISYDLGYDHIRYSLLALKALHEFTEMYIIQFLQDAYMCTIHRGRVTLSVKDVKLIRFLRGVNDLCN